MKKNNNALKNLGFIQQNNNSVLFHDKAEDVYKYWVKKIYSLIDSDIDYYNAPSIIAIDTLKKGGYIDHFPHQVLYVKNSNSTTQALTPATCFHIYHENNKSNLDKEIKTILVEGNCFRAEEGKYVFPFRLRSFRMIEIVLLGSKQLVEAKKAILKEKIYKMFEIEKLNGKFLNVTDAFFLGESDGAKVLQQLKELKQEYTITIENNNVAIASINYHEQYFAERFNIRLQDNSYAFSSCIAFGLERLVAASLLNNAKFKG